MLRSTIGPSLNAGMTTLTRGHFCIPRDDDW